jgi:hypothetical protein
VNKPQDGGENWLLPFSVEGEHWKQLRIPKRSMFWSSASSLAALSAIADFYKYLFCDLLRSTEEELHAMLPSRLEIAGAHLFTVFDEIREELQQCSKERIDFSFFRLFEAGGAQASNPSFKRTPDGAA